MTAPEADCLERQLEANASLMAELAAGVSPGTPLFDEVTAELERCKVGLTFAPSLVADLDQFSSLHLTDGQRLCLQSAIAALPVDKLDALVGAGVVPSGEAQAAALSILEEAFNGCEIQPLENTDK